MGTKRVKFCKDVDDADEIPNSRILEGRMKKQKIDEFEELPKNSNFAEECEKKHTLDSDEEDESAKYQRFDAEKFEGQEAATEEYDGRTKIMAFNMDEDMDEGHFDVNGTFIYNKKENIIKDAWLDNVNWDNVKNSAGKLWQKDVNEENIIEKEENLIDEQQVYQSLLKMLSNKTETIAAALKRLNAEKGLSAAEERKQRWAAKKAGIVFSADNAIAVSELTSLADSLISLGQMEAYQLTAQEIQAKLNKLTEPGQSSSLMTSSEPFDMFGDEPPSNDSKPSTVNKSNEPIVDPDAVTMWEWRIKKENGELEETVFGPVTTTRITEMQEGNYFSQGAQVRRVGTETFYDIKRIDFDLFD